MPETSECAVSMRLPAILEKGPAVFFPGSPSRLKQPYTDQQQSSHDLGARVFEAVAFCAAAQEGGQH
jgi:hypothetical protein